MSGTVDDRSVDEIRIDWEEYCRYQDEVRAVCPVCKADKKENYEHIAIKRSMKTAHILATKEASKPDPRFNVLDVYTTMFRKIYEHEYTRNMHVERERAIHFSRIDGKNKNIPICDHHDEFTDEFCNEVHRKVEGKYASCKWPKPLPWKW